MSTLKNITVVFLSLMICYTSSGMSLFIHVCGGRINNISLTETDTGCGMETKVCDFSKVYHKTAFNNLNDCCKNQTIKNNLKVKSSEKVDDLHVFLDGQKINAVVSPLFSHLYGYPLNDFDDISPHNKSLSLNLKKGIYLRFQNFRN